MAMFLMALVTAFVGAIPLLARKRAQEAAILVVVAMGVSWCVYYLEMPSLVWPFYGVMGGMVVVWWSVAAIADAIAEDAPTKIAWFPLVGLLLFVGRACLGWSAFNAPTYASMLGEVEERVWTQDVQPKDPRHVRLVSHELAMYLAGKQLGEASGAIGSRFQLSAKHATLQIVAGDFWYVIPLDYRGFTVWQSADYAPGYVMVHAEDPFHPVRVVADQKVVYTPGAYFGKNLERHLRSNGYIAKGLTDYTLEIDDDHQPWWVVTVYEPTVQWWGRRVTGVVIVHPTTGVSTFSSVGNVPAWVDRVVPGTFVQTYLTDRGALSGGWLNSWWGKLNLTEPETSIISYGFDGEPYWVTATTSTNPNDEALLSFVYVSARTGTTVSYRASGGTEAAVLQAVDNEVKYKHQHATDPVLYNIAGTMAAITPILGESHTFQGVGIVRVDTMQTVVGDTMHEAYGKYLALLASGGQQEALESAHAREEVIGTVVRFARDQGAEGAAMYLLLLEGVPHVFTGGGSLSRKLPLTQVGDEVTITYVATGQDVEPMLAFDNRSIVLQPTPAQVEVRERTALPAAAATPVQQ